MYDRDWYRDAWNEREKAAQQKKISNLASRGRTAHRSGLLWKTVALLIAGLGGALVGRWIWENLGEDISLMGSAGTSRTMPPVIVTRPSSVQPRPTISQRPALIYAPEATRAIKERSQRTVEVHLLPNRYGNFLAPGTINGQEVLFMIDTGASFVSIPDRLRWRLKLTKGNYMQMYTASEITGSYATQIDDLAIGPIHLNGVSGNLRPKAPDDYVLLGMSALKMLEINHSNHRLILRQRVIAANAIQPNRPSFYSPAPQFKRHLADCMGSDKLVDAKVMACMEGK